MKGIKERENGVGRGVIGALRGRSAAHIGGTTNRLGLALLVVVLCVYFDTNSSNFLAGGNIIAILVAVSSTLLAAMAAGRLLVAGNVDLSIGGQYALLNVVCALVARSTDSLPLAALVALGGGVVLGAVNGYLVRILRISPIIVTLGLASVYTGFAYAASNDRWLPGPELADHLLRRQDHRYPRHGVDPGHRVRHRGVRSTAPEPSQRPARLGDRRRPVASKLVGLKVDQHVFKLFVYMGASMGFVALLSVGQLGAGSATVGLNFELQVLTAVVLGGVADLRRHRTAVGIFVGVMLIGVLNSGLIFVNVADYWQQVASGGALLAALGADQFLARQRRGRVGASQGTRVRDFVSEQTPLRGEKKSLGDVALRAEQLVKAGAVTAVNNVSFSVRGGEVLCLVGDNGAGKSTVIKMLSGAIQPDTGSIFVSGRQVDFTSPIDARKAGVETVFQDLALCPNLGAAYNISYRRGAGPTNRVPSALRSWRKHQDCPPAPVERLGVDLDSYLRPISLLSGGQRQSISIARVVKDGVRVVILDEPTAALGVNQTEGVLQLTRTLADAGAAVIMITHDVPARSIIRVARSVVVLNLGRVIADADADVLDGPRLVHLMAVAPPDLGARPAAGVARRACGRRRTRHNGADAVDQSSSL